MILVVSTCGLGEFPANSKQTWLKLQSQDHWISARSPRSPRSRRSLRSPRSPWSPGPRHPLGLADELVGWHQVCSLWLGRFHLQHLGLWPYSRWSTYLVATFMNPSQYTPLMFELPINYQRPSSTILSITHQPLLTTIDHYQPISTTSTTINGDNFDLSTFFSHTWHSI